MVMVALVAYVAATAVGMVVGSLASFWLSVAPIVAVAMLAGIFTPIVANTRRIIARRPRLNNETACDMFASTAAGATWGALAGSFAASTCGATHARSLLGSEVSALVMGLVAVALVVVADMLPRAIATRPHALCGLLFLATVGLALALGAEAPAWP